MPSDRDMYLYVIHEGKEMSCFARMLLLGQYMEEEEDWTEYGALGDPTGERGDGRGVVSNLTEKVQSVSLG